MSEKPQLDTEIKRSQQQWKKIDNALEELYELKGMASRETWGNEFSEKAKALELPLHIFNHLFEKYYERRLEDSSNSLRVSLLRDFQFLKLERWLESLNYSIAHLDIFPILDKLQTLSIIGALVLVINGIIRVNTIDYESRYRAWEIINTHPNDNIDGGTRLGLQRLAKQGASLENLEAENANLDGINLRNANLKKANLKNTKLRGANLSNANLSNANLSNADLKGVILKHANLSNADLSKSNLSNAELRGAKLRKVNLKGAKLYKTDLSEVELRSANLMGTDLRQAILPESRIIPEGLIENLPSPDRNKDKNKLFFAGVLYDEATQVDQDWQQALEFSGIEIKADADLSKEDLSERDLSGADLSDANLKDTIITGADLTHVKLNQIEKNNITRSQLKLACNWEKAFYIYREVLDETGTRQEVDAEVNQNYINEIKQDQASDPQALVDCSRWENNE